MRLSEPARSWVRIFEAGSLTEVQTESLQAIVDSDEAGTLLEAMQSLEDPAAHTAGQEPGTVAY